MNNFLIIIIIAIMYCSNMIHTIYYIIVCVFYTVHTLGKLGSPKFTPRARKFKKKSRQKKPQWIDVWSFLELQKTEFG